MNLNNNYFLLRHGQTIYQKEGRKINYKPDENFSLTLTKEGEDMIREAAGKLKLEKIDLVFASPFLRTKQSAEIVANIIGIEKIDYDERLVDINLGEFLGRPQKESTNFFSKGKDRFKKGPKGGESWNDVLNRVKSFLNGIEKEYKNKNILIISHADPIWLMAGFLKGFKKEEQFLSTRKTESNNLCPRIGELIKI